MIGQLLKPFILGLGRRRLPKTSGNLSLPGLKDKVEVIRDRWGVPHIYAKNNDDLAVAQGFVHAQDRLWQMELNRRVALGKVSELFGEIGLDTDRTVRTFGFHRVAKEDWKLASDEIKHLLQKYVDGINAFIEHKESKMPLEFSLVGIKKPEKWDVVHLLAFSRLMSWQMCFAWQGEIIRSRLIDAVGEEKAAEIDTRYRKENPIGLPKGIEVNRIADDSRVDALKGPFIQEIKGSNAWAISKEKSSTGKPFLCNDPHLPLSLPSIWYENHLIVGDEMTTGVTVPGLPMVLIGHNDHIAWGMTLAYTDIQDLYIEKFKDDSNLEYEYKGQWEKTAVIEEEIKIKGKPSHTEKVLVTRHGPVISDVANFPERKVAIKTVCLEPGQLMEGWYKLNKAKGWDDFTEAIKYVESPALNVTYADVHGNIGYYMSGKVPIRSNGKGKLPAEGWTGENEWTGYVPCEEMPHALNPEKGHVVSCNHKVVDDDFPHFLGDSWMNGYRAARLEELLTQKDKYSPDDYKNFHLDYQSMTSRDFKKHFEGLTSEDEKVSWALNQLQNWDGSLEADSTAGLIFEVWRDKTAKNLLEKPLSKELTELYRGKPFRPLLSGISEFYGHDSTMLLRLLDDPDSWWMEQAGGKEDLILKSLADAMEYIESTLGKDRKQWRWGRLHQHEFIHAVGSKKPFDKIFNIGPFEMGGDTDTVHQTAAHYEQGLGGSLVCASWRQIVDMGDLSKSLCILPPGNSGQPGSPNYDDQAEMWYKGQYRPMLWTREQVEEAEVTRLVLG